MSATSARQGGRVQLEKSDTCLALNMPKIAKEGYSRTAIEDTQELIKAPHAKARDEKKRGGMFPGYNKLKAVMERHPAMVWKNQTDGCLPCQNGIAKYPQTRWRLKGTGAPPARPAPRMAGMPPAPPGDSEKTQTSER